MFYQSLKHRKCVFYCFARVSLYHKANEEAWALYYNVIKHSGHLRILEKCRKHSPAACVFNISLMVSNAHRVLSQCNTRLRFLYLLITHCLTKGHVRYINILTRLRGFRVKILYLVVFSLYPSLLWELRDKTNLKNLQFWPKSLGAMLEYWYIERGLWIESYNLHDM